MDSISWLASAGVSIAISPTLTQLAPRVLRAMDLRRGGAQVGERSSDSSPPRRFAVICVIAARHGRSLVLRRVMPQPTYSITRTSKRLLLFVSIRVHSWLGNRKIVLTHFSVLR